MRALIFERGRVRLEERAPDPGPAPGESRVRVRTAGLCATDLALLRGYMGFEGIPGHEFVGVALEGPLAGRRVVGEINAGCGACRECRADLARHCSRRTVLGILGRPGCFAEILRLPDGNLLPVPDEISDDAATFVEPLAAALEIAEQVDLKAGLRALVVGDGRLGCLCAQVLASFGVRVWLAGRHPERIGLLRGEILPIGRSLLESPRGPEELFDFAVEATGRPEALPRVIPWVRPRGTLVLKTTGEASTSLDLASVVVGELTLLGSRCGRFAPALAALAAGSVEVEALIEARYPLREGAAAVERAARGGILKILLDMEP